VVPSRLGSVRVRSRARRIAGSLDQPQPPVCQSDDAVEAAGEIEVVGRDQGGEAGMADELEEGVQYALAGRVVEVASRLVAEQDLGAIGERAGDRDPLLLAAGEPRRPVSGTRRQADTGDQRSVFARARQRSAPSRRLTVRATPPHAARSE
jgi:hypothetical protein